jgi:hypothetical protein
MAVTQIMLFRLHAFFRLSVALLLCVVCLSACPARVGVPGAVDFLSSNQTPSDKANDFKGNWPQYFYFEEPIAIRFRDVSPFTVTFIHHALNQITPTSQSVLGLTEADVTGAREMQRAAVDFLLRFEADPAMPDAGAFGFWPLDQNQRSLGSLLMPLAEDVLRGPILAGNRVPWNVDAYPTVFAHPSDADSTSTICVSLLEQAAQDDVSPPEDVFTPLFEAWRDTGASPLRRSFDWLPEDSGVFLTWLTFEPEIANDVDIVVNANVLFALARLGRLDAEGADEAVALINNVVAAGLHRSRPGELSDYYPDNYALHYCISRAYYEGPVPKLAEATAILADDVAADAVSREDGTVFWDKGDPHLTTAFALLTLLNAGRSDSPLLAPAKTYLLQEQDACQGTWDEGAFFVARSLSGITGTWVSEGLTTGLVLEALCRIHLME